MSPLQHIKTHIIILLQVLQLPAATGRESDSFIEAHVRDHAYCLEIFSHAYVMAPVEVDDG